MILDAIRNLLTPSEASEQPAADSGVDAGPDPLHVAACALLLEIAHADGEFSDAEQKLLEHALARQFGLTDDEGRRLMDIAENARRKSVDHFAFTSVLQRSYNTGQKMVLAEVMWAVVLADGQVADHEQYLTRKISNLLELEPAYLSSAKAAAEVRRNG